MRRFSRLASQRPPPLAEFLEERLALAVLTVTNTNDTGAGSLRQAILDANSTPLAADTIGFDPAVFSVPRVIDVLNPLPQFSSANALSIIGPGSSLLTVRKTAVGAAVYRRVFDAFSPTLVLSGMTLTGGNLDGSGGGGLNCGGVAPNVTLDDMIITGNTANGNDGGGIFLNNNAKLTIRNSVVSNNSARRGGGIYFFDGGTLAMENCTIAGNTAFGITSREVSGGGFYFGGPALPNPPAGFLPGTLLVQNSTISNNTAATGGGGGFGVELNGTLLVRNSTVSGNTAVSSGGGIMHSGAPATITIENGTITNNSAGGTVTGTNATGGGGISRVSSYPGTLNLTNSVVSGNHNPLTPDILTTNTTTNARYSAIGTASGFTLSAASGNNLPSGIDLLLGPLANYGGRTATHLPSTSSRLLNAGSNALIPAGMAFDQRGPGFPRVVGPAVDIGAVERPAVPEPPAVTRVFVSGSAWTASFKQFLQSRGLGDETYGYQIPGGADQLKTLPWLGIDRVSIGFSQDVAARGEHLAVSGTNVATYAGPNWGYDPVRHVLTMTLAQPLRDDRVTLTLNAGAGGVATAAGVRLDGEWSDGARGFPSGNATQGGNFVFRLNALPGDADRTFNRVNAADQGYVKARLNRSATSPTSPTGGAAYSVFADVTGDGRVNAADQGAVKARLNDALPPAPLAAAATFSPRRVADDVLL